MSIELIDLENKVNSLENIASISYYLKLYLFFQLMQTSISHVASLLCIPEPSVSRASLHNRNGMVVPKELYHHWLEQFMSPDLESCVCWVSLIHMIRNMPRFIAK